MAEADVVRAAGAVVWRSGPSVAEVLLVHRPKYDDWSLPKGKREPGEHMLLNAVREVHEETGTHVILGRRLRGTRYPVVAGIKEVGYWAAQAVRTDPEAVPNAEVDEIQWLPVEQAIELASYDHDMSVLRDFARKPLDTVPVIVVRHASAGSKKEWRGDDVDRPLDAAGAADARALADLLTCFAPGPARVLSSPALRCADTVRPYAKLATAGVEINDSLARTGGATVQASPIPGLVAAGQPAVLCVHRENVPTVVEEACVTLGAKVPDDLSLPKAGFWVLHIASGTMVGLDRYTL
jgi:8-oxo-dGTP diphosphatase